MVRCEPSVGLLALVVAGCGIESPLQILTGEVVRAQFTATPTELRAIGGAEVVAAGLIDVSGRFVLAVPAGELHVELITSDGGWPLVSGEPVRICSVGAPFDLGTIAPAEAHCLGTPDCVEAEAHLQSCEADIEAHCQQLTMDVDLCRHDREVACDPLEEQVESCESGCEDFSSDLDDCLRNHDCGATEDAFWQACLRPCDGERQQVDALCRQTVPCEAERRVVPARPLPADLGCSPGDPS